MTKEEFLTGSITARTELNNRLLVRWKNKDGIDQNDGVYAYFHHLGERKVAARYLREVIKGIAKGEDKKVKVSDIETFIY